MSSFCANAISFDTSDMTCKVKGGDNNIVPRSNQWSNSFPIPTLLSEISGGMIRFTTRNEKNLAVEQLVDRYAKKIRELTGFDCFQLSGVFTGNIDELIAQHRENIAYYKEQAEAYSSAYKDEQIAENEALIELYQNPTNMHELRRIVAEFTAEVVSVKPDKLRYVLRHGVTGSYIYRLYRGGAYTTKDLAEAKRFTKFRAEEVAKRFEELVSYPA